MRPRDILTRFDSFLASRGLTLDAIVVGGAALELLGVISRETKDCDVIYPDLPVAILEAARAFASQEAKTGWPLTGDWLNNGPASLMADPCSARVHGLDAHTACAGAAGSAPDQAVRPLRPRNGHQGDCLALRPTVEELADLKPWVQQQDANLQWPAHVDTTLQDLARRLSHGV